MTDRPAFTLTVEELRDLVREEIRAQAASTNRPSDLPEEMTIGEVVALFRLATKSGPKTIFRWRQTEGFPAPRKNGKNRVTYLRTEVNAWRAARAASGSGATPDSTRRRREGRAANPAH